MPPRNLTDQEAAQLGYEIAHHRPRAIARVVAALSASLRSNPDLLREIQRIVNEEVDRHVPPAQTEPEPP